MTIGAIVFSCGLSFLFLVLVFRPLEMAFPAKAGQKFFRPAWFTDLCFFLGQYLLWTGLVLWLLGRFGGWLDGIVPANFRAGVAASRGGCRRSKSSCSATCSSTGAIACSIACGFLWRFHSIHHSAEHLDWLAAHREHPLDTIYTMGLINLPAFLLGLPAGDARRR